MGRLDHFQSVNWFKQYCAMIAWHWGRKKNETYEEKANEFGNVIEKKKVEEKEEDD